MGGRCDYCNFSPSGQAIGLTPLSESVVINDLPSDKIPLQTLLNLLDEYPYTVDIKGAFVPYLPSLVIITTILSPEAWCVARGYSNSETTQICRRVRYKCCVAK